MISRSEKLNRYVYLNRKHMKVDTICNLYTVFYMMGLVFWDFRILLGEVLWVAENNLLLLQQLPKHTWIGGIWVCPWEKQKARSEATARLSSTNSLSTSVLLNGTVSSSEPPARNQPYRHLDVRLLVPWTTREYNSVVLSHPVYGTLLWQGRYDYSIGP